MEIQRCQIVDFHQDRLPRTNKKGQISEGLGFSKTAVHQEIVRFKKSVTYTDAKGSGRFQNMTPRTDILMKRQVVKSPRCSIKKKSGPI